MAERAKAESTNLEQRLGVPYNIKEATPPCYLRLARTTDDHVRRGIEMIQKFDYSRENPTRRIRLDVFQVCLCFHNRMQKDLERVSEEGQFLVVRSKSDSIFDTAGFEVV